VLAGPDGAGEDSVIEIRARSPGPHDMPGQPIGQGCQQPGSIARFTIVTSAIHHEPA